MAIEQETKQEVKQENFKDYTEAFGYLVAQMGREATKDGQKVSVCPEGEVFSSDEQAILVRVCRPDLDERYSLNQAGGLVHHFVELYGVSEMFSGERKRVNLIARADYEIGRFERKMGVPLDEDTKNARLLAGINLASRVRNFFENLPSEETGELEEPTL